jgi:hypothetical protein
MLDAVSALGILMLLLLTTGKEQGRAANNRRGTGSL